MIRNFLDRGTAALLTVLPDRHDVIECISTASQFYILEAIKVVLNKPIDHFHLRLLLTLLPWPQAKNFFNPPPVGGGRFPPPLPKNGNNS